MSIKAIGVRITADPSSLVSGLRRSGQEVERFDNQVTRASSSMTRNMLPAIVGISSASLALVEILHRGYERFTSIENASASLKITLGDTAKVSALLGSVLDTVQGTPFNLDQFIGAAKNLIAVGEDASRIPAILRAVGEAAAASGNGAAGVDTIVDSLQRMEALGHTTLEEINSLSYQGVPALQILANTAGVTTDEMRKMITDGAVPARQAVDQLVNGIMHGTDGAAGHTRALAGSMEELRKTTSGALGGLGAAVARLGAGVIGLAGGGKPGEVNELAKSLNAASGGLDKVTRGLAHMQGATRLLLQHKEVLEAVAVLYGAKMAAALAVMIANQAGVAAGWLAVAASEVVATAATEGVTVALGGLLLAAAPIALALGAVFALKSWSDAQNAAKSYVETVTKGLDASTVKGRADIATALDDASAAYERNHKVASGWFQTMQAGTEKVLPFFGHGLRDAQVQQTALTDSIEKNSIARYNEISNIQRLHALTGLHVADLRRIAQASGADLAGALSKSGPERQKILDWLRGTSDKAKTAGRSMDEMTDAADKVAQGVSDAFSLVKGFELPDPTKAAQEARDAADGVASAQERLADAQTKVRENERYSIRTPAHEREHAAAVRDVAKAQRELADAQQKARDAQTKTKDPAAAVQQQARRQVAAMTSFVRDMNVAIRKHVDPHFLSEALADPEKYAPILHAIATAHDAGVVGAINANETQMRNLRARISKADLGLEYAVDKGLADLPPKLRAKIEQALTAPMDVVVKIKYEEAGAGGKGKDGKTAPPSTNALMGGVVNQQPIPQSHLHDQLSSGVHTGPDASGSVQTRTDHGKTYYYIGNGLWVDGKHVPAWFRKEHPDVTFRALGGIDAHIATSPTVLYGERSTGGEAFIPLGMQNRARSTNIMAEVARVFGDGYAPRHQMERGGIFGGGVAVEAAPRTVVREVHHHHVSMHHHYEIGEVRAHDYRDFEQQMERKARIAKLAGAM